MLPLNKQFSQSSLQKKIQCWFSFKNGSERTFSKIFNWSSEKSEVFWSLWLIRSATSKQTVFTVIIGKNFSVDFRLNTGVRGIFLTLFKWSCEKSEFFSSLWLIRSATSIQTFFTVIIGKNFSADFHLNTEVRGLFLTLFLVFWKEWSFLILMTNKDCYLYTNSFHSHHCKKNLVLTFT